MPDPEPEPTNEPDALTALFTRSEGDFRFARWGRALAPVIYGTDDAGVALFETGLARVATLAGLPIQDLDPELGANFMVFFVQRWPDLKGIPHLERLIPDLAKLVDMLGATGANQYRIFGFDDAGAIRICLTLIRYDDDLQSIPGAAVAVHQSLLGMLLWSDTAFLGESPVARLDNGECVVKPWYGRLLQAAYDPTLPDTADDPAFAWRLAGRMQVLAERGT
ncbi:MAG: hypothetical protein AAGI34_17375 [Pseudomonadota bacterium]